jgi:hypothetical protein
MNNFGLTKKEEKILRKLNSPRKIQDFLDKIPINFEPEGDTCFSPRKVLKENRCHCIEGAFLAAAIFWLHGKKPLVIDLKTTEDDFEHVVAVFKENRKFGAISKTNHPVLRYREPVYNSVRELVMSYFHEYFKDNGKKTLRSYSMPINLLIFGAEWITSNENLWHIHDYLDTVRHYKILNKKQIRNLRKADKIEIEAGKIVEWKK